MEGDTLPPRISARSTVDSSRCFSLLFCTLRVSEGYFHEIYIKAANTQFSGFMLILEGLENGDRMHIVEANEKLDEGRKLIRKYKSELQALCDKNNVELELS